MIKVTIGMVIMYYAVKHGFHMSHVTLPHIVVNGQTITK
jgi:hypothetical protein